MHSHNSLDAVSGLTSPRERSQYSWFLHNLANRHGLSGVHGPGFGPGASLRVSPSHPIVFPHHGLCRSTVKFSEDSPFGRGALQMAGSAGVAAEAVEVAPRTGGVMSGGSRGTGPTQAEVDAITADFRAAGGVVDQSVDAQLNAGQ